jgi:hypothetical protein
MATYLQIVPMAGILTNGSLYGTIVNVNINNIS